jgi:hypothetical protein
MLFGSTRRHHKAESESRERKRTFSMNIETAYLCTSHVNVGDHSMRGDDS